MILKPQILQMLRKEERIKMVTAVVKKIVLLHGFTFASLVIVIV